MKPLPQKFIPEDYYLLSDNWYSAALSQGEDCLKSLSEGIDSLFQKTIWVLMLQSSLVSAFFIHAATDISLIRHELTQNAFDWSDHIITLAGIVPICVLFVGLVFSIRGVWKVTLIANGFDWYRLIPAHLTGNAEFEKYQIKQSSFNRLRALSTAIRQSRKVNRNKGRMFEKSAICTVVALAFFSLSVLFFAFVAFLWGINP